MKINELEKVWEGKRDVRQEVESRWYTRKGELEDEVRAKLDAEFGVELAAAKAAEKEAEDNYDEENIRLREKESEEPALSIRHDSGRVGISSF